MAKWLGSGGSMTLAVKRDGTARIVAWSTNCAWCFTDTDGPEYCSRCERLRCEYCGKVGAQGDMETCSECVRTLTSIV